MSNGRGGASANAGIIGYLNGSAATLNRVDSGSYVAMTNTTASLYIAKNGSNYSDGNMDELAIWNTELTSTQIQSIYDATSTNLTKDLTTVSGSNLIYWNRMGD